MIGTSTKGWIGVDIGTHAVKLVQIERRGTRIHLSEAMVVRRREAWQDSGFVAPPPAESSEEMRAGLALGQGFTGRNAAVTLTMSLCDVRGVNVPEGSDAERREMVARELQALAGHTDESREFDFWPVDLGADQPTAPENVLAASISCDWAQRVAQDLTAAKLVGQTLDALPLVLARAIEIGAPGSSQVPVAAVDWGYRRATLCVVLNGRPMFVRCLRDSGFASVIATLGRSLSLTSEESQKLLTDHGLPSKTRDEMDDLQEVIAEVVAQPLQIFAEELERTMAFLHQQRRALVPQKIVLFGGGAAMRNIGPFLTDKVDVPIAPWNLEGQPQYGGRNRPPLPLLGSAVALSALAWETA